MLGKTIDLVNGAVEKPPDLPDTIKEFINTLFPWSDDRSPKVNEKLEDIGNDLADFEESFFNE